MSRWWLPRLFSSLIVGVVLLAGVFTFWPRSPQVTQARFDCIRPTTNFDDAVATLGPPGDYTTGPVERAGRVQLIVGVPTLDTSRTERWRFDEAVYSLHFRPDGGLDHAVLIPARKVYQSAVENLLWRANRQWHRWCPSS